MPYQNVPKVTNRRKPAGFLESKGGRLRTGGNRLVSSRYPPSRWHRAMRGSEGRTKEGTGQGRNEERKEEGKKGTREEGKKGRREGEKEGE